MPKTLKLSLFFFLFTINLLLPELSAQNIKGELDFSNNNQIHIITTQRGDVFVGRIIEIINTKVSFQFKEMLLTFKLNDLKTIEVIDSTEDMVTYNETQSKSKNVTKKTPYPTMHGHEHLPISPTGFNLKKGQGEYRVTAILLNMVDYGISDNFSIGVGMAIPFLIQLRAKYTYPILPKVRLGIGTNQFFTTINRNNNSAYNHSYGVMSVGTTERFLNASVGYFFPFSEESTTRSSKTSIVTLGGGFRMGKHWRVMIDNLILPNLRPDQPRFFPTLQFGWFNQKNRIDFGVMTFRTESFFFNGFRRQQFLPYPIASYSRRFGK